MYPEGDRSVPASGRLPKGGFYFDSMVRQPPIDDANLNVEDNLEEFRPISDEDLLYLQREAERLYTETDKAILANFGGTAFGDIALVPGPWMKHPKESATSKSGTSARRRAAITCTRSSNASARSASGTWRGFTRLSATRSQQFS